MGDPRKIRKTYRRPAHPWQRIRIETEKAIEKQYGLKNKREIWKVVSELGRISAQAKRLIREKNKGNKQTEIEEKQLLSRLMKYNLINEGDGLDIVLSLKPEDLLDRRLQTFVLKSDLALTAKQARQFIVHGHVLVNGQKVTVPSYMIGKTDAISFNPLSTISDQNHPERSKEKKKSKSDNKNTKSENAGEMTEEELAKIEKEIVAEVDVK